MLRLFCKITNSVCNLFIFKGIFITINIDFNNPPRAQPNANMQYIGHMAQSAHNLKSLQELCGVYGHVVNYDLLKTSIQGASENLHAYVHFSTHEELKK